MIGNTLIELNRVDSTNAYAGRMSSAADIEDGTVIWALEQIAGRGQHDHAWTSEAGKNLTFTVCLKPVFLAPDRQFQLNKAISLGVLDFVRDRLGAASGILSPVSRIKWPNDIYLGNNKAGGILIEHKIMGSSLETSFAGIGLNINQTHFPPDLPNPVSLIHFLGHESSLKEALVSLCGFISMRYQDLVRTDMEDLNRDYDHSLLGFEEWRLFLLDGVQIEGRIMGVDTSGRLMVEQRGGGLLCCAHREIVYVL